MSRYVNMHLMDMGRYFENISNEYIKNLPAKSFEGSIFVIDTIEKSEKVKPLLMHEDTFGFDTETKPAFKKGQMHPVALVQLATNDKAFLFRLNRIKMPEVLVNILCDPAYRKIGVAIKEDLKSLGRSRTFKPEGFIELQEYVKSYGISDNGLKKLVANVLGFRISKRNQTSNWERDVLSEDQQKYAATDAWVCLEIFRKLNNQ